MRFLEVVDRFIGDEFKKSHDLFQKVRLLVGAILAFQIATVFFGVIYAFIPGIEGSARIAYIGISVPAFLFWFYILKLIKASIRYEFSAHSVIASTSLVLFAGVAVTGGPLLSEVHPLLMALVIFAFLLLSGYNLVRYRTA